MLIGLGSRQEIAGFASGEVATLLVFVSGALVITGRAAIRSAGTMDGTLTAGTLWLCLMTVLGVAYSHRRTFVEAASAIAESSGFIPVAPQVAEASQGTEVTITRRGSGGFVVPARVNDRPSRFVFDTGASTVVITQETAAAIGIKPEGLAFRVPVGKANGVALAAPVVLDTLAVGTITMRRVPALVVKPGLLAENLLGQTFLERLASYEVRGTRLVFRARRG